MARPHQQQGLGKRRMGYEEWMEEDDLLEDDLPKKRDLRDTLQNREVRRRAGEPIHHGGGRGGRLPHQGGPRNYFNQKQGEQRYVRKDRGELPRGSGGGGKGAYPSRHTGDPSVQSAHRPGSSRGDGSLQEQRTEVNNSKTEPKHEGSTRSNDVIKCFRCTEIGHHQLDCTNEPVCYKCKKVGHMAVDCAGIHQKKLKSFGFGIAGQGFYSIELPEKRIPNSFNALLLVKEGRATEERLDEELRNLIKADWDFHLAKVSEKEYRATFPDQGSIDTFSKLSEIKLALYGITVKVVSSKLDPAATSMLQSTWVKIFGIPDFARDGDTIKEVASLAGEPIKIDEFSMVRDEPVRVRLNCRDPAQLRGTVEIFFNGTGYAVSFVSEGTHGRTAAKGDGPPGPGKKDDRFDKGNEKDKDTEPAKRREDKGNRSDKQNQNGKEQQSSQEESQDDSMEDLIKDGSPEHQQETKSTPIAAYHPDHGLFKLNSEGEGQLPGIADSSPLKLVEKMVASPAQVVETVPKGEVSLIEENKPYERSIYRSELDSQESVLLSPDDGLKELKEVDDNNKEKIVVHSREGTYLLDKEKWPVLKLPEDQSHPTHEEDIMDTVSEMSMGEATEEEESQGWLIKQGKKKKSKLAKKVKKPVIATRSSSRVVRDGVPISTKAMLRTMNKNDLQKGAHSIGKVRCRFFADRINDFGGTGAPDGSLDQDMVGEMRAVCGGDGAAPMEMGYYRQGREVGFGAHYYASLLEGRGILRADQQLTAGSTVRWVRVYASGARGEEVFREDFAHAMVKLSGLAPLTGADGQVRISCSKPVDQDN